MKLWIDDMRNPNSILWRDRYGIPADVVWAKTYDEAYDLIMNNVIEWVGFDNDLGDYQNRQGKHLFAILEEQVVMGKNPMFEAVFQTSNSVARQQMLAGYNRLYDWWMEQEDGCQETT